MNNKFFNKKHRQMNAHLKTKTTFRSKITALLSLLLLLNFATAWGQNITMNSTSNNRSTAMTCGNTYTLKLENQDGNRTYTFTSTEPITVESFDFTAIRYLRNYYPTTYDYLQIEYNGNILTYGNDDNSWGSATSRYWYKKTINVPGFVVVPNNGTSSVVFKFVSNINSSNPNTHYASFTAKITTPPCCPTLTAPTDGAIVSASSIPFSWEAYNGASSYTLYIDDAAVVSRTPNRQYTHQTPLADGEHTWKVVANNASGNPLSTDCPTRTFMVCSSLSCVNPNSMTPRGGVEVTKRWLSWDPVPCATGYNLYYSTDRNTLISEANKKVIVGGDNTQYLLPIMPEGVLCYWTVIPTNEDLTSPTCGGTDYIKSFKVKYTTSDDKDLNVLPSTEGNEFYFSFMENGYYPFGNDRKYTAVIAPSNTGPVTFHFYSTGRDEVVNVTQGVPATVTFSESDVYHYDVGDQYSNRTVKVTCNFNISLYIANEATNSFDASIVLPTSALGTEYMIQTYPNGSHNESSENVTHAKPCFMVIGTADNTPVRISGPEAKIRALLPARPTSGPEAIKPDPDNDGIFYFDITIDEGESYFMRSNSNDNGNNDLSGIEVKVNPQQNQDKCKTISVFNGNTLTRVPYLTSISSNNRDYNMDHLFEQAYPTSNWGTKFAITSSLGFEGPESGSNALDNLEYEYIRITALEDDTEITINGGSVVKADGGTITGNDLTLDAGETGWYALHRDDGLSCYIETTKPVACYFYQRSGYYFTGFDGDPSMVWISPIELGIDELTFATFSATGINPSNHYINIVIPIEAINNGQTVTLSPPPYNSTNTDISSYFKNGDSYNYVNGSNDKYAYARVRINHGTYTLRSNGGGKMVIHAYGIGEVRGYAYNAGSAAIEYRSNFVVGGADGNTWLDVSSLKDDHHFCSGTTYRFRVNSNATNVERVEINYGDGNSDIIIPSSGTNYAEHQYSDENEYEIEARVYSRVYDNELCQEDLVVDIIRDVVLSFASEERNIDTTICPNTEFKFQEKFYQYNSAGVLEEKEYVFPPSGTILVGNTTYTKDTVGYTKYGCKVDMYFSVKVYDNMDAGSIITTSEQCINNSSTIQLSVTKLLSAPNGAASGGDPTAHYQWQYSNSPYNDDTPPSADDASWSDINNQGETHTATATGWYRRAYISKCGTLYSNAQYANVEGAFNPGVHADASIKVCSNEEVDTTIGTKPVGLNAAGTHVTINETSYGINFQWQDSVRGDTWNNITANANAYQYNVSGTFEETTFYRRLITGVGDCQLALDMGVFTVEVKPTFNFEYKVFSGCSDGTKAKIQFTITDGSGTYKVYYMDGETEVSATNISGGVYEFSIPANTTNSSKYYNIKIEDQLHGCQKSANVEVKPVVQLSITNFGTDEGCRGAQVSIPYPTISGGTAPYTLELQASSLGINSNVTVPENTSYTISKIPETADPGPNTVLYKVTDASGCYVGPIGNGTIIVYANPDLKISKTNIDNCASPNGVIVVEVRNPSTSSNPYLSEPNYTFVKTSSNSAVGTTTATQPGTTISYQNLPQGNYVVDVTDGHGCKTKSESVIIEDYLNIEIGTSATVEGESIADVHGFYVTCPKSIVKLEITSLTDKTNSNPLSLVDYTYSFDGGTFGTTLYKEIEMPAMCTDVEVSIRAKSNSSSCIEERRITIEVRDDVAPTITGGQTINIPTYFCETFEMPILADLIAITGESCGIKKVDITQTSSPAVDGKYNVAANQTNGITVTVKATNLCDKASTPAQIVVKPIPWPNFEINGTDTDGSDNDCYCHGDNITLTAVLGFGDNNNAIPIGNDTYPGATYQWYKVTTDNNGDEVATPITDGGRYSGADTKELKISSAISTEDDADNGDDGVYKLVITDPKGCTKEATITICVHPNIKFNLE